MQKIIFIFILTTLGCTISENQGKANSPELHLQQTIKDTIKSDIFPIKELAIKKEEGISSADIRLSFVQTFTTDSEKIYEINSTYENRSVGFEIIVPNKGLAKLTIKSLGANSDNFLHVLQKLYHQKVDNSSKFSKIISADCLSMGDYVDSLNKTNGNYTTIEENKLFFQGQTESDYAELYLNINEQEHWIELAEKDSEYRPVLIRLLTNH